MATDNSTLCKITNQSGKDMVIALALSGNETPAPGSVTTASRQLALLPLAEGGTVLKNGATGSVSLNQSYQPGSGEEGPIKDYDLTGSDSTWLYPLVQLSLSQLDNGTGYPPQTVTPGNTQAMSQAINFYQLLAVYPDSQLADDYMKALSAAKEAAVAKAAGSGQSAQDMLDAIDGQVSNFFKTTKEYADVTLADMVAVDSYYANFPFVWAQYKDSLTYYLYGSDGETGQFVGTVSLDKEGAADGQKANAGYTCLFAPAIHPNTTSRTDTDDSKAVPLTYAKGLFVDDATAAKPKIALKGSFLLKQFFTAKEEDTQVMTVVGGQCNGVTCIGFDTPQPSRTKHKTAAQSQVTPVEKYWNALVNPKSQLDMLISILTFVGAVAFIAINAVTIYKIYRWVKARRRANEPVTAENARKRLALVEDESEEESEVTFGQYTGGSNPQWKKVDFAQVRKEIELERLEITKAKLLEGLEEQRSSMDGILEYFRVLKASDVVEIQSEAVDIGDSIDALNEATPEKLKDIIAAEYKAFSARQPKLKSVLDRVSDAISDDTNQMVTESLERSAKIVDQVNDMQHEDESEIEDEDPFVRDPIRPWEWIK
ncbi:MAG: hypothetical protein INR73_25860 [Williamsia sp.]|nr:hypothetical protein [Williamsia sp.]